MFQGDWQKCEKLGAECVKAALEVPGGPGSDYPFWIWGRALTHTGNPERALTELQRAVEIAVSIGDATGLAEALVSLGEAHLALKNYAKALECSARAQKIAEWTGLGINLAQTRVWRAWIGMQADPSSAPCLLGPIRRSVEDFEIIGTLSGWACAVHALGHALMLSGRTEMARCYLETAAEAFLKHDMPWHRKRAQDSLAVTGR